MSLLRSLGRALMMLLRADRGYEEGFSDGWRAGYAAACRCALHTEEEETLGRNEEARQGTSDVER